jgi:aminomethyltransferase
MRQSGQSVGIFDVGHLGKLVVRGEQAYEFLNATLTNDLGKIQPGKAQYTLLCDDATGGVVDDLIVYFKGHDHFLLVPNAANCAEVKHRLSAAAPEGVTITDHHETHVVLAVQGTKSDEVLEALGSRPGTATCRSSKLPTKGPT